MMQYLIYTLIPATLIMLWAFVVKIIKKDWKNLFFIFIAGVTLIINAVAVYEKILTIQPPLWIVLIQLVVSPTIVPQAYLYFCRQMGTKGSLGVNLTVWLLMLLLFVPSLSIDIHPFGEPSVYDPIQLMHFNIYNHGKLIYAISIPSLIILFQAIATSIRIPIVVKALHVYELKFSAKGKSFLIWWIAAILFIVFSSLIEMDQLRQPTFAWGFYISYAFLITMIYAHIALGLDIRPIETTDEEEVENMDAFIAASKELAERAKRLFIEEKLYLRPEIVTDDVVRMLGTNRTYFTRMMRSEFNMSFHEFITYERIEYSKTLLTSTEKTLEEIAEESGFSNASSYCRVFKRQTNTSPDVWRKEHQTE